MIRFYLYSFFQAAAIFSAVLIPIYTRWGHINQTEIQILQSWFMLWIFLLEVPTGVIADRFSRKASLIIGSIVVGIACLIYGSFPSFSVFLLGEFLFAAGVAFSSGADEALLYDSLKEKGREGEMGKILGRVRSIELAAMFLAAPIGGIVAGTISVNAPMYLSCLPYFVAAIVAMSIKETMVGEKKKSESLRYLEIVKAGKDFFVNNKEFRKLTINSVLVASSAYFVIWFYQPLLTKLGVPIYYFGLFHAGLVLGEILILNIIPKVPKRFGGWHLVINISALITGVAFIIAGVFPSMLTVVILLLFAGGFGLTRANFLSPIINHHIPSEIRATTLSSVSMFKRFLLVVLNPIFGFIADKNLSLALISSGALALLVFFLFPLKKSEA
jgi:MFS family permease